MSEEENILQTVIEKESWEEIIYHIVSLENLDPWNIDLVKLTNSFIKFLRDAETLDFRIPAKIVFVAAILLKLKADNLSIFEEETTVEEVIKEHPFEDLGIDPNLVELGIPMKRIPKRQITLEELMSALKKAIEVRERKIERKRRWRAAIQAQIVEEDITKRIEKIMKEIDNLSEKLKTNRLKFRQIVGKWDRDNIVEHLVPILHLEQDQKVKTEQEDFFKEIFVTKQTE